eukprot:CAMPEP_0118654910 /NCGR_PEP_ID=MMETSP0785-20121206/12641_1 /TAXON_ID=91992 /ORGANISM="Bolidomonas pacifica, Strain CCMP 1866" /LENGTH=128 /DNA_ID=CAMNT_0006547601 /DNA_START=180 /DNA_END=563 /DNA_ORIENTATION=-
MLRAKRLHSNLSLITNAPIEATILLTSTGNLLCKNLTPTTQIDIKAMAAVGVVVADGEADGWIGSVGLRGDRVWGFRNVLNGRYYLVCVSSQVENSAESPEVVADIESKIESRMTSLSKYLDEALAGL